MQVYILNVSGRAQVLLLLCLVDLLQVQNVVSRVRSKQQTCTGQYRCTDGSCVPDALDRCPNGCAGNAPKKCSDGSCISSSSSCERTTTTQRTIAKTTRSAFCVWRCADGINCVRYPSYKCPNGCTYGKIKCPRSNVCIDKSSSCANCNYRCPNGRCVATRVSLCTSGCFYNQKKCPRSGRCTSLTATCGTSNPTVPCTSNTFNYKCPDGECVLFSTSRCSNGCFYTQKKCPSGSCINSYSSCTGVRCNWKCQDGKCVSSRYSRCSNGCYYNKKKCPDGSCIYSYQSCIRCNYKCPDGKCVSFSFSRCSNGCYYNQKKCPGGSCIYSYKSCSSTCKYRCTDGKCVSSRYSLCSNGCSQNKKKCPDGSCKYNANLCCQYRCPDGKCLSRSYTRCSNGCRYNQKKCSDGTCKYRWSSCSYSKRGSSSLVGLVALPVIIILIICAACCCGWVKKRSSPTMTTNMTPVTSRGPVFTTGPGVPVQPMHVNTAYFPDWQNGASNGYPAPSSPGVAAPPPAYQDALNDGVYPTVQPQKSLDEGLPTYESVAYMKPEELSNSPSVTAYPAQSQSDAAPQAAAAYSPYQPTQAATQPLPESDV